MEWAVQTPVFQEAISIDGERQLVGRAKHDRDAFATLYRRHYQTIGRYIFRRVGDRHLTDDLVADVFMIALQNLYRYRHRGLPFRSWLYRIATNRVNRWARRARKQKVRQLDTPMADERIAPPDAAAGADEARAALLKLAPKYQAILVLHYIEGLSITDIAAVCGCRTGTVKSRLSRGRDALRQYLPHGRMQQ
ncbi:MAG: RNA polymerase sigma factor [Phycisphaerae bacterium]